MIRLASIIAVSVLVGCERAPTPRADTLPASAQAAADGYEQLSASDSAFLVKSAQTFANIRTVRQVLRIPLAPECGADTRVQCFADTTRVAEECCGGGSVSDWLLLLDTQDSLEFFVVPGNGIRRRNASFALVPVGTIAPFQEHDINTAPYLRYQFPGAGTYTLSATIGANGEQLVIPFELRVRDDVRRSPRRLATVHIDLPGDSTTNYFVRRSRNQSTSRAVDSVFMARAGRYRVLAPGADSIFVCTRDCESVRAISVSGR
jgi:hypothetical protein